MEKHLIKNKYITLQYTRKFPTKNKLLFIIILVISLPVFYLAYNQLRSFQNTQNILSVDKKGFLEKQLEASFSMVQSTMSSDVKPSATPTPTIKFQGSPKANFSKDTQVGNPSPSPTPLATAQDNLSPNPSPSPIVTQNPISNTTPTPAQPLNKVKLGDIIGYTAQDPCVTNTAILYFSVRVDNNYQDPIPLINNKTIKTPLDNHTLYEVPSGVITPWKNLSTSIGEPIYASIEGEISEFETQITCLDGNPRGSKYSVKAKTITSQDGVYKVSYLNFK